MIPALYFAYGSNLDPVQLAERCPSALPRFRARLDDHRIDFTHFSARWTGGAADVLPHSGRHVWGVVYEMDASDLTRLDRFERSYDRVLLRVEDDASEVHRVSSYTVRHKDSFRPTEVYLEKLLCWGAHWGLPPEYLGHLRSFRVSPA